MGWYDDTLIDVLKQCGITYCRTVESTENFDLPENWLAWNPTCHHDDEALFDLADEFVSKQNVERPLCSMCGDIRLNLREITTGSAWTVLWRK